MAIGTWLSLVEHYVRDVGVAGSNPVVPTNKENLTYRGGIFLLGRAADENRRRKLVQWQAQADVRTPISANIMSHRDSPLG